MEPDRASSGVLNRGTRHREGDRASLGLRDTRGPLLAILILAFVARLPGLWFGLPRLIYDKDEQRVVGTAVVMFTGDWNPHEFRYASFFFYLVRVCLSPLAAWLEMRGLAADPADLIARFVVHPTPFYVIARAISLIAGIATVWITARVARRLAGEPTGWLAALFVALAPLHIELSSIARVDAAMTCGLMAALFFALRYEQEHRPRDVLFAALCAAGSFAAKYTALLIVPALILSLWGEPRAEQASMTGIARVLRGRFARIALVCALLPLALLLTSPYIVLDSPTFVQDAVIDSQLVLKPYAEAMKPGYALYPGLLAGRSLGLGIVAAAALGVVALLRSSARSAGRPLLAFAATYVVVMFVSRTAYERFLLPLVPTLAVFAAIGVIQAARTLRRPVWAAALVAFVVTLPHTLGRVVVTARNAETRLAALELIERSVPSGSLLVTGIERFAPPVAVAEGAMLADIVWMREHVFERGPLYRDIADRARALERASGRPAYRVIRGRGAEWVRLARGSSPAGIVLSEAEDATLPDDVRAAYAEPATFAPGLFQSGPRIDVLLRRP
jgi:4-amino-4-deoxy-L-arabinose transferase-like glycosyltransferase